jgi:hypothetical protein
MQDFVNGLFKSLLLLSFCSVATASEGGAKSFLHPVTTSAQSVVTGVIPNVWQDSCSAKGIDPYFVKGRLPMTGTAKLQPVNFLGGWEISAGHSSIVVNGVVKNTANSVGGAVIGFLSAGTRLDTTSTSLRDSGAVMIFKITGIQKYRAPFSGTLFKFPVLIYGTYNTSNGVYLITLKTTGMSVSTMYLWTIFCLAIYLVFLIVFFYTAWLLIKALRKYLRT